MDSYAYVVVFDFEYVLLNNAQSQQYMIMNEEMRHKN